MLKVTLKDLSSDARAIHAGTHELGECDPATLLALLDNLRDFAGPLAAAGEAEPEIIITNATGKFLVRSGARKLFLYNARDSSEPYAELSAADIVAQLTTPTPSAPPPDVSIVTAAKSANRTAAFVILFIGILLNGYTLYSVFYTERVNQRPPVTLLTDEAEIQGYARRLAGTYQTGDAPGDRAIIIADDGTVRFIEFGTRNRRAESMDTYEIGRHEGKICFSTAANGVVDVGNIDVLVYYRDSYRRVKF